MPFKLAKDVGFKKNLGSPDNFRPLGVLEVPHDVITKLPSGIRTEIAERYDHLLLGIKQFNDCYSLAINSDSAQQFRSTTQKLKATVRDPNASVHQIGQAVRQRREVLDKDGPAINQFTQYMHLCDYYQRPETWEEMRKAIAGFRIDKVDKEKRLNRLTFLQTQWMEHAPYAHYPTELLLKLVDDTKELEDVLENYYLKIESAYFNNEAKFFFDDVRCVLAELKRQREIIANAAYHRLRVAKKKQDPDFSDLLMELRSDLQVLGAISSTEKSTNNIIKSLEAQPRRELNQKRVAGEDITVADELVVVIQKNGSEEIKARLSNLNTYDALAQNLAVPVTLFEKNILPLPGIYSVTNEKDINTSRFAELNLNDTDSLKLSRQEKLDASRKELGWWDRWTQCHYNITTNRSFQFYNACAVVAQRNQPLTDNVIKSAKLIPPLTEQEILILKDTQKSKQWIKSNADHLLKLLDPNTANSPVIKSWASFSWWPWSDANRVSKIVAGYKRIFEKAKEGSVQYLVPTELEKYIPLTKGDEGSYTRVRHDFFLGKTYVAQFNELAHAITNEFEERFKGLNRPEHNVNPLTRLETTLRLKQIAEVEKIIVKMEAQIAESLPSSYNPRNWFSGEAKKTRAMLDSWKLKVAHAKNDLETKKKQIATFIADNIDKYIDETAVNAIDVVLVTNLKLFVTTYGSEENKKTFKTATTIGGVFAKYVKENRFVKMTSHEPKQNIAINLENIKRILAIGLKLSPRESKNYQALERVCDLIKGKIYPANKVALYDDLKHVLGVQTLNDKFVKDFINNVIKPYWNPYAKNAEAFIRDILGSVDEFDSFKRDQSTIAAEKHALLVEFLQQKALVSERENVVPAEKSLLSAASEERYRLNQSARVYAPGTIYEYVDHHNPINIVKCDNEVIAAEQIQRWDKTLEYARSHALQSNEDRNPNQSYGNFNNGANPYAAEVISKIGDFQSIYHYTLRLLRNHLSKEHTETPYVPTYQLPLSERALFLEKHPQATLMAYLKAINEYVSNIKFKGQSHQFAQLIIELCASSNVKKILKTDKRAADDLKEISDSIDIIKQKARESVIAWGVRRFEYLIQSLQYQELHDDDNSFYQLFLADEPELQNRLQACVLDWLFTKRAFLGNHNAFWKIITWLGDYKPSPKGYLTNQYARVRFSYLFENKLPLNAQDDLFLKYNRHVEGFLQSIILSFLMKLETPGYSIDRHDYLSLVLWLKSLAIEDESIRDHANRLISAYAKNRLNYLLSNNIPLDAEDWKYLNECKETPGIKEAIAETINKYVDACYDGNTTTFMSLILGYQASFTGNQSDKQFLYQPYSITPVVGRYVAKRLRWLMLNGKSVDLEDLLITDLLNYPSDEIGTIKDIAATELSRMLSSSQCNCWITSDPLFNETIQSYTAFIQQIVTSRTKRSEAQLALMEQYVSKRLWFLMKNNQSSAAEEGFFYESLNEERIKGKLSEIVLVHARTDIIALDDFSFIRVINKLNSNAVTLYYSERFKYLLKQKDKTTFPAFDLANLSDTIKLAPLNKSLNEGIKSLLTSRIDHMHHHTIDDQRLVQLLQILALHPENEQYVADHAALMLSNYLEAKIEPPAFFRDFCHSHKNEKLEAALDEVVRIYLDKHRLIIPWGEKSLDNYVMDASLFSKHHNFWYKIILNYANDRTYDDCIVPIMHSFMRLNAQNGFADFKETLKNLELIGNKQRSIPSTAEGRARFDALIDGYVYLNNDSLRWNNVTCQVVEDNCCSEAQKDKYRCGELVRRLVNEGSDQKEFNAFFEIADKTNWDRRDITPRQNFITQNRDTLNRAIDHCLNSMPWHGNAQRVIHNYASPDIATQYHTKWFLSQLEHRPANLAFYNKHIRDNYSSIEDDSNRQNYPAESRLNLHYGVHLSTIVSASRSFLEQMRQDNILAIEIIESHFSQCENHQYKQELMPFIERYNFVMLDILKDWKNNCFADATRKLKSRSAAAVGLAAVQSSSWIKKQAWETSYIERAKHCAEEYIKTILHSENESPARREKIINVAKSFIDSLPPTHDDYKVDGEFLYDLSKGNEQALLAAMRCAEALAKIQQIVYLASQKPLAIDLMFYDNNELLNVFTLDNVLILATNLPKKELNILLLSLHAASKTFTAPHPLANVLNAFANELTMKQDKSTNQTQNDPSFERFASIVAINRQMKRYFDYGIKPKSVATITAKDQAEFELAYKDDVAKIYLESVVEKLLSDRGLAIIQREDDEFEIDNWQAEFIKRFGSKIQQSRLAQINQARIIFNQLDQLLTHSDTRGMSAINLSNIMNKQNAALLAKHVVENIKQKPSPGSFRIYIKELICTILKTQKVSQEEIKLWPFIAAYIKESGLESEVAGEIRFLVSKALVMLDPQVGTAGESLSLTGKIYIDIVKAFGSTSEKQSAELIIEYFIRGTNKTRRDIVAIAGPLANERQRKLLESDKLLSSETTQTQFIHMIERCNSELSCLPVNVLKNFSSIMTPKLDAMCKEDFDDIFCIVRWIASQDIKHIEKLNADASYLLESHLMTGKIKTLLPVFFTNNNKTQQRIMLLNLKLLIALTKLKDNMATLIAVLDTDNERAVIAQCRSLLTAFNDLIAKSYLVEPRLVTDIQKSKESFKRLMLEKYPQLFAPPTVDSVVHLFDDESRSDNSSDTSSPGHWSLASSIASSAAPSRPGTPPTISRSQSRADLTEPPAVMPFTPPVSPCKTASPSVPLMQRQSSFFGLQSSLNVKPVQDSDKDSDGLNRYIDERNKLLSDLFKEIKPKGIKPASFDEKCRAIIEANKCILTIAKAIKDKLHKKIEEGFRDANDAAMIKLHKTALNDIYKNEVEFLANIKDDYDALGPADNGIGKDVSALFKKAFDDLNYTALRSDATPIDNFMSLFIDSREAIRTVSDELSVTGSPERSVQLAS